ncbi:IclR family transcriptional regulator [Alkalihalophilus marmarensis]|uniref:Transcriptional regulator, IclR family n=1 Tax=Alkalihalophilus marmarensis DSM 21297 TaxID=1188261 RepID=U6SHU3_9BACI|nr:IclR family transcriptional regulator [Alkalihalophilus marmarensis]ERN51299.1 hypothetical protein A33I_20685 [Alkalihalophilus marmarensis DSM 21297]MCM3491591.1 IclR family transcriptional regulator [Alkalihalophilus marmarensis]
MEKEQKRGLQTVHRAISLLNCFTLEETELSLTEISEKIKLPKSTTSRIVETLIDSDMLQRNEHNFKYKLGYNLFILGRVAEHSNDIIRVASPIMRKLRDQSGESVSLYKIVGDKRVCIERFMSNQAVSHNVLVGTKLELDIGSAGKAMLAFQDEHFIETIINNQLTKAKRDWLVSEINKVKKSYLASSFDERGAGVNAISSPIFSMSGNVSFALCLSGPSLRFSEESMEKWSKWVKEGAKEISKLVGCEMQSTY